MILQWCLTGLAWGQAIENGTYETGDLTGWTAYVGGGWLGSADVQDSWGSGGAPTPFPDGDYVLDVDDASGACSDPFVVTRGLVSVQASRPFWNGAGFVLAAESLQGDVLELAEQADSGGWSRHELDIESLCSQTVSVCLRLEEGSHWFDLATLEGAACPDWVDQDGDGTCPRGQDLDGDGECAGLDEWDLPGSGDADTDADTDSDTDTDTDADSDADADADTDTDADADADSDADADADSDTDGPDTDSEGPDDEKLKVSGGCGCTTGGAPASLLGLPLLAVLLGRRRR